MHVSVLKHSKPQHLDFEHVLLLGNKIKIQKKKRKQEKRSQKVFQFFESCNKGFEEEEKTKSFIPFKIDFLFLK
jgi:hypothetical protein